MSTTVRFGPELPELHQGACSDLYKMCTAMCTGLSFQGAAYGQASDSFATGLPAHWLWPGSGRCMSAPRTTGQDAPTYGTLSCLSIARELRLRNGIAVLPAIKQQGSDHTIHKKQLLVLMTPLRPNRTNTPRFAGPHSSQGLPGWLIGRPAWQQITSRHALCP